MINGDVSTSIWTFQVFSSVLTCALLIHREVGDGGNFQNELFFWRDLFRLNSQRVLRADDVELRRLGWTETWISPTIGASLVVGGIPWKTRFRKVRVAAAANLNDVLVIILSKGNRYY